MSPTSNSTCTASEHVSNNFTNLCNHISLLQISQPQTASLRERESVRKTRIVLASIEQATMKEWDTNRSSTCESYESSSNRIKYCKSTTNINNTTNARIVWLSAALPFSLLHYLRSIHPTAVWMCAFKIDVRHQFWFTSLQITLWVIITSLPSFYLYHFFTYWFCYSIPNNWGSASEQ